MLLHTKTYAIQGLVLAVGFILAASAGAAGLVPANSDDYHQIELEGTPPESYDRFGWAIAAGDFDCDGTTDYAVGIPRENVGNVSDAGIVQILYGSDSNQVTTWHQDVPGVRGECETGDQFGYALAVGNFDSNNCDDLAIGIPFEDIDSIADAGAVQILYGLDTAGLSATGNQLWNQGNGIAGQAEARDQFGFSLAAGNFGKGGGWDLAIGVPREDVADNSIDDAGAVHILYGSVGGLSSEGNRIFRQGAGGLQGKAEDYDLFGWSLVAANFDDFLSDGYDDLAVGIPYENLAGPQTEDAGAVQILYGSSDGLHADRPSRQIFSQESGAIEGAAENGDWFGFALAAGDFDGNRHDDLAVGIPLEDLPFEGQPNAIHDAGAVQIFYGKSGGLGTDDNHILSQSGAVAGAAEGNDEFGRSLAAGNFDGNPYDDLAVGVPLENHDAIANSGAVNVLYGSLAGLSGQGSQIISQSQTGVAVTEKNDHFGFALCVDRRNGNAVDSLAVGAPRETLDTGGDTVKEAGAVIVIQGSS